MGYNQNKYHRSNAKARRKLEELGYEEIQLFYHTRFQKDIHIGGLGFDGICRKFNRICLFQIKSNQKPSKDVLKTLYILSEIYKGCQFLWITCPDRKPVEVYGL